MSKQPGWPLSLIFFLKLKKTRAKGWIIDVKHIPSIKKSNHKKNEKPLPIARSASASPTNQRRPFVRAAVTFVLLCEDRLPPLVRPSNLFPNFFFVFYFGVPLQSGLLRQDYYCLCVSVCVCVCERERERERTDRSITETGGVCWMVGSASDIFNERRHPSRPVSMSYFGVDDFARTTATSSINASRFFKARSRSRGAPSATRSNFLFFLQCQTSISNWIFSKFCFVLRVFSFQLDSLTIKEWFNFQFHVLNFLDFLYFLFCFSQCLTILKDLIKFFIQLTKRWINFVSVHTKKILKLTLELNRI